MSETIKISKISLKMKWKEYHFMFLSKISKKCLIKNSKIVIYIFCTDKCYNLTCN